MLVEDNKIISMELKQRLEHLGYEVFEVVSSGEEAISKVTELSPDLILMDIKLKGKMDGIEAAGKIDSMYHIPIVYVTAYEDEETVSRARFTHPKGYLVKPLEEESLHSVIEASLHKNG